MFTLFERFIILLQSEPLSKHFRPRYKTNSLCFLNFEIHHKLSSSDIYWNTVTSYIWKHSGLKNTEYKATARFLPIKYTQVSYLQSEFKPDWTNLFISSKVLYFVCRLNQRNQHVMSTICDLFQSFLNLWDCWILFVWRWRSCNIKSKKDLTRKIVIFSCKQYYITNDRKGHHVTCKARVALMWNGLVALYTCIHIWVYLSFGKSGFFVLFYFK